MKPLSALFKALESVGIVLDVAAARDAVWLASTLETDGRDEQGEGAAIARNAGPPPATVSEPAAAVAPVQPAPAVGSADRTTEGAPGSAGPASLGPEVAPTSLVLSRLQVPRAAGLAGERGIPDALRTLRRRRRSPAAPIDEVETVRRAIEDDLWLPAYQPIADRWLELALVVDHGVSMAVWQELARDLRRVFTRAAVFRDVRVFSLASEGDAVGLRRLSSRVGGAGTPVRLRSPFGGGRRGLVLVMTDCVSDGWYDGRVLTLLEEWSRQSPVALLQVLPERLWKRTALAEASRVKLRAVTPTTTNPHLHWVADLPLEEAGWRTHGAGVTPSLAVFPIATAAPASLRRLARMVTGVGDEALDGAIFEIAAMIPPPPVPTLPAAERVRRFWSVSSSAAAELASLLSATPAPSTGVLALLRRELLPGADASAEAELLFSGLVRVPRDADIRGGDVPLEFPDGVRPRLLQSAPVDRVLEVLRRVAAQRAIPGIKTPEFESWLVNPSSGEAQLRPSSDPVAAHLASVLEQIGGRYARIVHPDARQTRRAPTPSPDKGSAAQQAPERSVDAPSGESAQPARSGRPMCFVIMGLGMKTDYATGRKLDLDKSYRLLIKPAVEGAGFECIRADEVVHAGVIDRPMYRHLLEADLVVADLSTSNANAIYQLGIRHGLRAHTTIVMAEKEFKFPFDLGHTFIRQYEHLGSSIDFEEVERVRRELGRAIVARPATPLVDSPIYTFLPNLPYPSLQDVGLGRTVPVRRSEDGRKVCFVTMGFGKKTDLQTQRTLDLDRTYEAIIRPAAEAAGLTCIRMDDVTHSGVIDRPSFEHLLSADVVVADLSTYNANALYDLGVRHALCPSGTVVMADSEFRFPFDVGHLSILQYVHLGRDIGFSEAMRAREALTKRIGHAAVSGEVDSPVYLFLPELRSPVGASPAKAASHKPADKPPVESSAAESHGRALVALFLDGIDVLHRSFLDSNGRSRIVGVWDQRDRTGLPPSGYDFGTYHARDQIAAYVAAGRVPDALGRNKDGLGTLEASVAAGTAVGKFTGGVAPSASILVVITTADEPIGYSSSHLAALRFVAQTASAMALPVVTHIAQGMNAGAHDGTSPLEVAFDEFSSGGRAPGRVIVKSAGNAGGARQHAVVMVTPGTVTELAWTCRESPDVSMQLELWWNASNEFKFRLRGPNGGYSEWVDHHRTEVVEKSQAAANRLELTRRHVDNGDSRLRVMLDSRSEPIQPGKWSLEIESVKILEPGPIHAWIERGSPNHAEFVSHVSDEITLSIPATARHVVTVGAVESTIPFRSAVFSSSGPTRDGRQKPDLAAPGVDIVGARGGTMDDVIAMSGTSLAAAHVSGAIAVMFSQVATSGNDLPSSNQIVQALRQTTANYSGQWDPRQGYGVLDIAKFVAAFATT